MTREVAWLTFNKVLQRLILSTPAAPYLLLPYRLVLAIRSCAQPMSYIPAWLCSSREIGNYTYAVTAKSRVNTAFMVSLVADVSVDMAMKYLDELDEELPALREHVRKYTSARPLVYTNDLCAKLGRRMILYPLVRAVKPTLIVQ